MKYIAGAPAEGGSWGYYSKSFDAPGDGGRGKAGDRIDLDVFVGRVFTLKRDGVKAVEA